MIFSFYFEIFINKKFYPILLICIFSYCVFSSLDNLAISRSNVEETQAIKNHPLKNKTGIKNKIHVYIGDLNYTKEKFHIPQPPIGGNIKNLIYEDGYFSKIYFKN